MQIELDAIIDNLHGENRFDNDCKYFYCLQKIFLIFPMWHC